MAHDPAWKELRKVAEQRHSEFNQRLLREFVGRDNRPDYEDLQWYRGFFAGMEHLLNNPTLEAKALEKELTRERTA